MKILIVGSGGREHTLAWKIKQSPRVSQVYCAPGNPGTAALATNLPIPVDDIQGLVAAAKQEQIDLTIVGPEAPLVAGITDAFEQAGLAVFGPSAQAAQIEGSKAWCHAFMKRHNIPCARSVTVTNGQDARDALSTFGIPVVLKASGLAAGKGALVCLNEAELNKALKRLFEDREFGDACDKVVIEEFLAGEEASCLALSDGRDFHPLVSSQDHKPVDDGGMGPNTGGMGAYAPAPVLDAAMQQRVNDTILRPVIEGMAEEGIPYKGVLYAGLMITAEGPKIIEFNCRFGDPETQVVLPLLDNDLVDLMEAATRGELGQHTLKVKPGAAVCVVLASGGYPGPYEKGKAITGLDRLPDDIIAFHAGTALNEKGALVTAGGRVLGLTATGDNIKTAIDKVYDALPQVHFDKMHKRKDIGHKALARLADPAQ